MDVGIWTAVERYFRSFYVWIPFQIFFPRRTVVGGGFPFPGGWLLGSLLLVNLLAAHAGAFPKIIAETERHHHFARRRYCYAVKRIGNRFVRGGRLDADFRRQVVQLCDAPAVDGAGSDGDGHRGHGQNVVAVPMALLKNGNGLIKSQDLPFDIQVVQYMVNSRLCKLDVPPEFLPHDFAKLPPAPKGVTNRATAGLGADNYLCMDQPETAGVDQNKDDQPAAYVRFLDKATGKDVGTYLLSVILQEEPQYVTVDGKKYDVRLRLKRTYRPYTVHLIKFSHDLYMGTDKPKNFSSRVRVVDSAKNEDREVLISMNNPLYYGGETFFQQSFLPGDQATILQVVRNPGWQMPYIAFVMVAVGMLIHFSIRLVGFLQRSIAA